MFKSDQRINHNSKLARAAILNILQFNFQGRHSLTCISPVVHVLAEDTEEKLDFWPLESVELASGLNLG